MEHSGAAPALRPLGLGEILDRGITLTVKHFLLFVSIVALFAIPEALMTYAANEQSAQLYASLAEIVRSGGNPKATSAILTTLSRGNSYLALLVYPWYFFILPFLTASLVWVAGTLYLGGATTARAALRRGLSRWPHLVGLNMMYVVLGLMAYLVLVLVIVILALALVPAVTSLRSAGIAIAVVLGAAVAVAIFAAAIALLLAYWIAICVCVLENKGFIVAFATGIERIFNRLALGRALLFGLAYLAVSIGLSLVTVIGSATIASLVRSTVLVAIYSTVLALLWKPFEVCFMTMFYYDLRVRTEAFDLQLAADALPGPATV